MKQYVSKFSGKELDERLTKVDNIPTKTSELNNDSGFISETKADTKYTDKNKTDVLEGDIKELKEKVEVNAFYIADQEMWLDKATRVGLKLRFDAEIASGQTNTTLWYEGTPFNLELVNAVQMLNAIELYASACYDNTQRHIANINSLQLIEDIKNYNYKEDYPHKLEF